MPAYSQLIELLCVLQYISAYFAYRDVCVQIGHLCVPTIPPFGIEKHGCLTFSTQVQKKTSAFDFVYIQIPSIQLLFIQIL